MMPTMAFIGVRNSWLILARNSLLAIEASSAAMRSDWLMMWTRFCAMSTSSRDQGFDRFLTVCFHRSNEARGTRR